MAKWLSYIIFGSLLFVWAALSDVAGEGCREQSYPHAEVCSWTCAAPVYGEPDGMPDIDEGRVGVNGRLHAVSFVKGTRLAGAQVAAAVDRGGASAWRNVVQPVRKAGASVVFPFAGVRLCYVYALGRMLI